MRERMSKRWLRKISVVCLALGMWLASGGSLTAQPIFGNCRQVEPAASGEPVAACAGGEILARWGCRAAENVEYAGMTVGWNPELGVQQVQCFFRRGSGQASALCCELAGLATPLLEITGAPGAEPLTGEEEEASSEPSIRGETAADSEPAAQP